MKKQLDDGILKGRNFPLKPKVLELKFERVREREKDVSPERNSKIYHLSRLFCKTRIQPVALWRCDTHTEKGH